MVQPAHPKPGPYLLRGGHLMRRRSLPGLAIFIIAVYAVGSLVHFRAKADDGLSLLTGALIPNGPPSPQQVGYLDPIIERTRNVNVNGNLSTVKVQLLASDFPPSPPSPYEARWKGLDLPFWARKPFFFNAPIPDENRVCFVHVGKTAGSTLGCMLGFQLHCPEVIQIVKGVLPRYATNIFHNGVNDCPDNSAHYLFALRNPLTRIQSWFVYDRPGDETEKDDKMEGRNKLYVDCPFETLNDLAERGLKHDGDASAICKARADNAIRGKERFGYHAFYNYHYYWEPIPDDATVLVVRTEHLVDDWNLAEKMLGGFTEDVIKETPRHNSKEKTADDKYLSEEAKSLLCEALCEEIQVYKVLLRKAINIDAEKLQTSLDELEVSCPVEAQTTDCQKASSPLSAKLKKKKKKKKHH